MEILITQIRIFIRSAGKTKTKKRNNNNNKKKSTTRLQYSKEPPGVRRSSWAGAWLASLLGHTQNKPPQWLHFPQEWLEGSRE